MIRKYKNEIKRISNCLLLDTSLADVRQLGPIEKNNPGYLIMNEGIDTKEFITCTGVDIACSIIDEENKEAKTKGRQGINRQKEDFVLAFAMDAKLGITDKIWKAIEDRKLNIGPDYVLFMAGLGGGTGSGSINGIASRFYKGQEKVPGSKHIVLGILPSIDEDNFGENPNRLRFNTLWALYELMRPIKRPNPLILLDNEAMDSNDPRPTKPVMDLIHMLCDWRPDKDAGDFFTKYGRSELGCKTMAPYYACIEKGQLRDIGPNDIDSAMLNFKPNGRTKINPHDNSPGRWFMTITEEDFVLGREKIADGNPDTGGIYILTKGLTRELREYLKDKVCEGMEMSKECIQPNDIVEETPMLNRPGKVEFLILTLFDSPLELSRIQRMVSTVDSLINEKKQFSLDNTFDHIYNKDARIVLKEFSEAMIKDMAENLEDPRSMHKHDIKFYEEISRFKVVDYKEED